MEPTLATGQDWNGNFGFDVGQHCFGNMFINNQTDGDDVVGSWNVQGGDIIFIGSGGESTNAYKTMVLTSNSFNNRISGIGIGFTESDAGSSNSFDWQYCYPAYPAAGSNEPCLQAPQAGYLNPYDSTEWGSPRFEQSIFTP